MNNLLINKYKPKEIEDLILDEQFVNFMNKLIHSDMLNLIIVGNSSSGKTTLVKLIIKKYFNQENNNNILYIHGTKDQGIQYYRNELQIFCKTCSTIKNKKKMVILDDFDLINEQSQQVFRNVMDNNNHSVFFIMTCINPHKLINSIQSRQLLLHIPIPNNDKLFVKCKEIIINENIKIHDDVLKFIISLSNNSIICIINYLQKIKLIDEYITMDNITNIVTHINFKIFDDYFYYIKKRDFNACLNIFANLLDNGYSVIDILDSLHIYLKQSCNESLTEEIKYLIIKIICKYITAFYNVHEDDIELIFFTNNLFDIIPCD